MVLLVSLHALLRVRISAKSKPEFVRLASIVIFISTYVSFLIVTTATVQSGLISPRLLIPIFVPLVLFVLVGIENSIDALSKYLAEFRLSPKLLLISGALLIVIGILFNERLLPTVFSSIDVVERAPRARILTSELLLVGSGIALVAKRGGWLTISNSRLIALSMIVFWLTYPGALVLGSVKDLRANGAVGYSTDVWTQSPVIKHLQDNPPDGQIYSNGSDALYINTGIKSKFIDSLPTNRAELDSSSVPATDNYLVWFITPGWRTDHHDYTTQKFYAVFEPDEIVSFESGGIYRLEVR